MVTLAASSTSALLYPLSLLLYSDLTLLFHPSHCYTTSLLLFYPRPCYFTPVSAITLSLLLNPPSMLLYPPVSAAPTPLGCALSSSFFAVFILSSHSPILYIHSPPALCCPLSTSLTFHRQSANSVTEQCVKH
jgi:hypothetical protein